MHIDYQPLAPYLLLTILALGVALLDTFPKIRQTPWLGWLTAFGALAALAIDTGGRDSAPWQGMVRFDAYSRAFNAVFLVTLAIVAIGAT